VQATWINAAHFLSSVAAKAAHLIPRAGALIHDAHLRVSSSIIAAVIGRLDDS
jgi:hypothetical protein